MLLTDEEIRHKIIAVLKKHTEGEYIQLWYEACSSEIRDELAKISSDKGGYMILADNEIRTLCVECLAWDEPVSNRDLALVKPLFKAQLKRVVEWGEELCTHAKPMFRHQCSLCWQALLEEVK